MNYSTYIGIVILAVVFGLAWKQGQLKRLADYVRETKEEMRKCTWPTWDELKGSTVVVLISIALLGLFTFGVDAIFAFIMTKTG